MNKLSLRILLSLILLGAAATVSGLMLYPQRMERGSLQAAKLPMSLGGWSGQDVAVEDYVKEVLETDDVVQRNYTNARWPKRSVQLAVVFSADNRRVAHPPEVCYLAAGWEANSKRVVRHPGLPPMVRLVLGGGGRQDLVYYCYKAGPELEANYYRQQLNIVRNQVMMQATSSALIRFSTSMNGSEDQAEQSLLDFIRQMMPQIQQTLP